MAGKRGRRPDPPKTVLGRRVHRLLTEHSHIRNITSLAHVMGMDGSNLGTVLRRQRDPSLKTLREIASALKCSTADLWNEDYSGGAAPYSAWRTFRDTELGRSMSPAERADLGALRFQLREPTEAFYMTLLLAYRAMPQRPREDNGNGAVAPLPDAHLPSSSGR